MTIKEFKDIIKENNIPDDAEIIIQADHGQHYEYGSAYVVTRDCGIKERVDLETVIFEFDGFSNDYYDDYALADYPFGGKVTGVVIFGE